MTSIERGANYPQHSQQNPFSFRSRGDDLEERPETSDPMAGRFAHMTTPRVSEQADSAGFGLTEAGPT